MKIIVVIPWRSQPNRIRALQITMESYESILEGVDYTILLSDTPDKFNLAQARNIGVLRAKSEGADIVVVGDADTIPQKETLLRSIKLAAENEVCVLPYTNYCSLTKVSSFIYTRIHRKWGAKIFRLIKGANGSVYVTKPELWIKIGGQNPNFVGWGGEDTAFAHAYRIILGKDFERVEGRVIAIQHGKSRREITKENLQLLNTYLSINNPDLMLQLNNNFAN